MDEALKLAAAICENAPMSVRESLRVAKQSLDHTDAELRELSAVASRTVAATEDYKEGPRAFIEKRAPRWVGR
jgi:enoyl-CoA hydratase/carnithine racemase